MIRVELPWPAAALSPNMRTHWALRAKAVKKHRGWAMQAALAAGLRPGAPWAKLVVEWRPPTRIRRDLDNLIGRFKAYQDGIADALACDDVAFRVAHVRGDVLRPAGGVIVTVETPA